MEHLSESNTANLPNRRSWLRMLVVGGFSGAFSIAAVLLTRHRPRGAGRVVSAGTNWAAELARSGTQAVALEGILAYAADTGGGLVVRSLRCTHAGCPLHLETGRHSIVCSCHGGAFDLTGRPVAGPPKLPLPVLEHTIVNGELYVRIPEDV